MAVVLPTLRPSSIKLVSDLGVNAGVRLNRRRYAFELAAKGMKGTSIRMPEQLAYHRRDRFERGQKHGDVQNCIRSVREHLSH